LSGPLAGRRVLLTRRWPDLAQRIAGLGGDVVEVPVIETRPLADPAELDGRLRDLAAYDWLVFTSASAVEAVAARLHALGVARPAAVRLASVGPATTHAIAAAWPATVVARQPERDFRGAALVEAFAKDDMQGRRVLLPVSDRALDVVERGLAAQGARVDRVVAYRTVAAPAADLRRALEGGIDVSVFASPSAVEAFCGALGALAAGSPAVAIGPTTEEAARAEGLSVHAVAEAADAPGLARAIVAAIGRAQPAPPA
jgi:uroporphyrinogen-III synthase